MGPPATDPFGFRFDNSYSRELEPLYASCQAEPAVHPKMRKFNTQLAKDLGLNAHELNSPIGAKLLSGVDTPEGASPLAQAYAGHQFGQYNPQLGDGRALLLGEHIAPDGLRVDIQLKGSGATPFSRGGDGKAALGPVLREYLIAEAMHALNVPTTRALAAVSTGQMVYRERPFPGAVLTRVASSHIRVGTFQYAAAKDDPQQLKALLNYTIARHFPTAADAENPAIALLEQVQETQARLIAQWMSIGFVHGVMNTDNMTVCGETIDYGPCAFLDRFDPSTVFSSIDRQGRYAYGNQPPMAHWDLTRFAEALLPMICDNEDEAIERATACLETFAERYTLHWNTVFSGKIGLKRLEREDSSKIVGNLLTLMNEQKADFTLCFRHLAKALTGDDSAFRAQFKDADAATPWLSQWQQAHQRQESDLAEVARTMNNINPLYIPRNHLVEKALTEATENDDLSAFEQLNKVLNTPFSEQADSTWYAEPAPESFGRYVTYCGT